MRKYTLITLGTDPEVPLYDTKRKRYVFAGKYIAGTKDEPHVLTDSGHSILTDNVMAEFTTPPAKTPEEMWDAISYCLGMINEKLPDHVRTEVLASAIYHDEELSDPQANEFFCEPDYNAWTCSINNKPSPKTNLRSAGMHIHIGYEVNGGESIVFEDHAQITRMCDLFLAIPALIYDVSDASRARRKLYGQAGAFRIKDYGTEYRSLSNFMLGDKGYIEWVFRAIRLGFGYLNAGNRFDDKFEDLENIINFNDLTAAKQLMHKYTLPRIQLMNYEIQRVA